MKILNDKENAPANALMIGSIVVFVGALIFMLLPKPTSKGLKVAYDKDVLKTRIAKKDAEDKNASLIGTVDSKTWSGAVSEISPTALAKVTDLANKNKIKLVAFRPQRINDNGAIQQLPFLVTVDGGFSDVMSFEKQLEKPELKLAVSMVQIASADNSSDRVTASINVLAYLDPRTNVVAAPAKPAAPQQKESKANGST